MKTSLTTVILFILLAIPVSAIAYARADCLTAGDLCQDQKKEAATKTVYTCPMHPEVVQDKAGKCPKCGMDLTAKQVVAKTLYTCGCHPEIVQDKAGKCPKCGMNLTVKEAKKDTYVCPMHTDVVQEKAGKCPKCGMDLVLKKN